MQVQVAMSIDGHRQLAQNQKLVRYAVKLKDQRFIIYTERQHVQVRKHVQGQDAEILSERQKDIP